MPYGHDLSNETKPSRRLLLDEGSRGMRIVKLEYGNAKSGNPMFTFHLKDNLTGYITKFYCVDVEGKRGNLKMILEACGVNPSNWDDPDVLNKEVVCDIVHEDNEWFDREGEKRTDKKHVIAEINPPNW